MSYIGSLPGPESHDRYDGPGLRNGESVERTVTVNLTGDGAETRTVGPWRRAAPATPPVHPVREGRPILLGDLIEANVGSDGQIRGVVVEVSESNLTRAVIYLRTEDGTRAVVSVEDVVGHWPSTGAAIPPF